MLPLRSSEIGPVLIHCNLVLISNNIGYGKNFVQGFNIIWYTSLVIRYKNCLVGEYMYTVAVHQLEVLCPTRHLLSFCFSFATTRLLKGQHYLYSGFM